MTRISPGRYTTSGELFLYYGMGCARTTKTTRHLLPGEEFVVPEDSVGDMRCFYSWEAPAGSHIQRIED